MTFIYLHQFWSRFFCCCFFENFESSQIWRLKFSEVLDCLLPLWIRWQHSLPFELAPCILYNYRGPSNRSRSTFCSATTNEDRRIDLSFLNIISNKYHIKPFFHKNYCQGFFDFSFLRTLVIVLERPDMWSVSRYHQSGLKTIC